MHHGFPPPEPNALVGTLDQGEWRPLALLLGEALLARLDKVIALALVRFADLLPLDQVARSLGVDRQILYVWQQRGGLWFTALAVSETSFLTPGFSWGPGSGLPSSPRAATPRPEWPERVKDLQRLLFHPEDL